MKLSDMMEAVTAYSKEVEAKFGEWQGDAETWANDAEAQAKAWQADAEARFQQAEDKFNGFIASATASAKAEWTKADKAFTEQISDLKAKTDEVRTSVATYEANARAEAAEAYAAALSKYAISVQTEAEKAMAFAAEQAGKKDT
ncbi:MAG: hypothetical protein AAFU41_09650 [Pseudomonadota bacterium]